MAIPNFITGDVPSATQVNEWFVNERYIRKAADESVTSSTTFQDDDELVLPVIANAGWELTMFLRYDGATAGDLKIQMLVPASGSLFSQLTGLHISAADSTGTSVQMLTHASTSSVGALGVGVEACCMVQGLVRTGGTAGNLQLQWAQNASSASATRLRSGCYMKLVRVE